MRIDGETRDLLSGIIVKTVPILDEKQKRQFLGTVASEIGYGGIAFVNSLTGTARSTIASGIEENKETAVSEAAVESNEKQRSKRIRKEGAGRKPLTETIPGLHEKIQQLIETNTYGNPEHPLVWTTWSVRKIADKLAEDYDIHIHFTSVGKELEEMGYSRQQNQKTRQIGVQHPDRDAQFQFINDTAAQFLNENQPVISIDTKKKENVGNFKNNGPEYRKKKDPRELLDHDFPIPELGKADPYGVYVVNNNTGFVNLGISYDTPEFAGQSVIQWWDCVGKNTFPDAKKLYITCDGGGSNGSRPWLLKHYVQKLADYTGLEVHVSHFPRGTSKWNKVEHRLFCYISKNWQGQPLIDIETIVNLIGSTTTTTGLKVICRVDPNHYEVKQKITEKQKENLNIVFVGPNQKWNYIIRPHQKADN